MNIFYTVKGDTQTSVDANSVQEAAQLLGVLESEVEDAGELPWLPPGLEDLAVDTSAYEELEKSQTASKQPLVLDGGTF